MWLRPERLCVNWEAHHSEFLFPHHESSRNPSLQTISGQLCPCFTEVM